MKCILIVVVPFIFLNSCYSLSQNEGTKMLIITTPCMDDFNVIYSMKTQEIEANLPSDIKYQGDYIDSMDFFNDSLNPWIGVNAIVSYTLKKCLIDLDKCLISGVETKCDTSNFSDCQVVSLSFTDSILRECISNKTIISEKMNKVIYIEDKDESVYHILWRYNRSNIILELESTESIIRCLIIKYKGIDRLFIESEFSYSENCQKYFRIINSVESSENLVYTFSF